MVCVQRNIQADASAQIGVARGVIGPIGSGDHCKVYRWKPDFGSASPTVPMSVNAARRSAYATGAAAGIDESVFTMSSYGFEVQTKLAASSILPDP